jgi:hypothetical protein
MIYLSCAKVHIISAPHIQFYDFIENLVNFMWKV